MAAESGLEGKLIALGSHRGERAGPGLHPAEGRSLYEAAAEVFTRHGCVAYLPHEATDPARHPAVEPTRVYEIDRGEIARSDLLVAFLARPSFGVGMELELAAAALVP